MKTVSQLKQEGCASAVGRFLRLPDVVASTGLSRATLYRMMKKEAFPRQVRLTAQCTGWWQQDIEHWLQSRRQQCPQH